MFAREVTWWTPVKEILGDDFELSDPYRTDEINIRDLLSHRTGLPRNDMIRQQGYTAEEAVRYGVMGVNRLLRGLVCAH